MAAVGARAGAGAAASKQRPTSRHCLSMMAQQGLWTAWVWTAEGSGSCTGVLCVAWGHGPSPRSLRSPCSELCWATCRMKIYRLLACVVSFVATLVYWECGLCVLGMWARGEVGGVGRRVFGDSPWMQQTIILGRCPQLLSGLQYGRCFCYARRENRRAG